MNIKQQKTILSNKEVVLVDKYDKLVGTAEKIHAHRMGLLHRAFSIFIFNNNNEVLLQQRSHNKYHCGGMWTNACCSHARMGEKINDTANTRLEFEMNLKENLVYAGNFTYKARLENALYEHEVDHVFIGITNRKEINPNPDEVMSYKWAPIQGLKRKLANNRGMFTPWLQEALEIATKHQRFQQI